MCDFCEWINNLPGWDIRGGSGNGRLLRQILAQASCPTVGNSWECPVTPGEYEFYHSDIFRRWYLIGWAAFEHDPDLPGHQKDMIFRWLTWYLTEEGREDAGVVRDGLALGIYV